MPKTPSKIHMYDMVKIDTILDNCLKKPGSDRVKVIEKCTYFYFGIEKLTPKLRIDQYCEKILGMLASKSFFSVRFGVAALPSLLPYR